MRYFLTAATAVILVYPYNTPQVYTKAYKEYRVGESHFDCEVNPDELMSFQSEDFYDKKYEL